ncbi:hypothetical protein, unlikely [Trypanosoma brucei gambiense DAL972]|uniref:T. brucei spp.-specific protein n=1 Tax=Trypanosoma brucei gambiense (strain MHOM/CI/86/DAL972) TaxID=679716 RepID=D0A0W8_TRYB9|nr:hypothetical protein, unlikely [Trypanosoma brucei gambiense DAL972]CBH16876.1 hypothetical protein, unlikely [Trypanosoma brucei gambiense DAL972]|eukprot:XP_011779140.1 hypothetical protein, unlikely [Trypanosoma brucei gambiense DAL972]
MFILYLDTILVASAIPPTSLGDCNLVHHLFSSFGVHFPAPRYWDVHRFAYCLLIENFLYTGGIALHIHLMQHCCCFYFYFFFNHHYFAIPLLHITAFKVALTASASF